MPTYTKLPLSGSSYGQLILLTATTSASSVPIHTAVAGSSSMDEIWLYAYNDDTGSRLVTVSWGAITEPSNSFRSYVAGKGGRTMIVDGMILQNGLTVRAYADAINVVVIDGFVNRISP